MSQAASAKHAGGAKYSRFGGEQRKPEDFVPAPDGSRDFGAIDAEVAAAIGGKAASIRLQEGQHDTKTGGGFGRRFANALRGLGFQSAESIFAKVESGEVGARPEGYAERAGEGETRYAASRDPEDFVPAPDGSLDFGHIIEEIAAASEGRLPAAPIRLQEGTPETSGRSHVELDKIDRIKAAGYANEIQYIADVAGNYTEVWEQQPTERHRQGSLLLVKERDTYHDVSSVEVIPSADGRYYTVVTAFPVQQKKKYPQGGGRKLLWRRRPTPPSGSPSAPTRFTPPSETRPGQTTAGGTGQNNAPGRPDGNAPQSHVRNALPSAEGNVAPDEGERHPLSGGGRQRLGDVTLSEADKQKVKDKLEAILRQLAPKANLAFVDDLVDERRQASGKG